MIEDAVMVKLGNDAGDQLVAQRRKPQRRDSRQTISLILETTARLLQEHGFEDLSTNLICKHAGLTPPALYHYYPNKYAILFELAHSLVTKQHATLDEWIDKGGLLWNDEAGGRHSLVQLQARLREVVDGQTGALWIIRGMRAIPRLREVRLAAHSVMRDRLLDALCNRYPAVLRDNLTVPSFLLGEIIHLGAELELDTPVAVHQLRDSLATLVVAYISRLPS